MNVAPIICAEVSVEKQKQIQNIFDGPRFIKSMENFKLVENWLSKHESGLGLFMNGTCFTDCEKKCYVLYEKIPYTSVGIFTEKEVDTVITATFEAHHVWKTSSNATRVQCFHSIVKAVEENKEIISILDCAGSCNDITNFQSKEVVNLIESLKHLISMMEMWDSGMQMGESSGVVAMVPNPTQSPIASISQNVCSMLVSGNCVLFSPNAFTSLPALFLAELFHSAGLPPGVFNVLPFESDEDCFDILNSLCRLKAKNKDLYMQIFNSYEFDLFWEKLKDPTVTTTILNVQQDFRNVFSPTVFVLEGADLHAVVTSILKVMSSKRGRGDALFNVLIQDVHRCKVLEMLDFELRGNIFHSSSSSSTSVSLTGIEIEKPVLSDNILSWRTCKVSICGFRTAAEVVKIFNSGNYCRTVCMWTDKISVAFDVANSLKCDTIWLNCQDQFDPSIAYEDSYIKDCVADEYKHDLVKIITDVDLNATQSSDENSNQVLCKTSDVLTQTKLFYDGTFKKPVQNESFEVLNLDGTDVGRCPKGSPEDISLAIKSARAAHAKWAAVSSFNRCKLIRQIALCLKERKEEFASILQQQVAEITVDESEKEVDLAITRLLHWGKCCTIPGTVITDTNTKSKVLESKEPVGVIAIICPDKYPLLAFVSLFSAAIANGNTVVLTPSEAYPVPALAMCDIFVKTGVPPGVINVIPGDVNILTRHLALQGQLDSIWLHNYSSFRHALVEKVASKINKKKLWVKKWSDPNYHETEYLHHLMRLKRIWLPIGKFC